MDGETLRTILIALGPAVGVVIGVWIRGRQQRRTRWHTQQQRAFEELLERFDAAKDTIQRPGRERGEVAIALMAFRHASHRAELIVPDAVVEKVQRMKGALEALDGSRMMQDHPFRGDHRRPSAIESSDAVGRAMNLADRARAEVLAAARKHLGI
jgi:hypothetical protein